MNKIELVVEMKRHGDTDDTLSDFLGISRATFSLKKNGKAEFTRPEMKKIKDKYALSNDRVCEIFFAD